MKRKGTLILIAIALLTLLLVGLNAWLGQRPAMDAQSSISPATRTARTGTRVTPDTDALKVGVYMSQTTRLYSIQIVSQLNNRRQLDVVPLLEPDTASDPEIAKRLPTFFPGKTPQDVTNVETLKKLDVIVAPRIWNLPDDARSAIEAAVTNGTGLLIRNGLGCMEPGRDTDTSRLSGFEDSQFGYNPHPMECEVIGEHPVLGSLSGKKGQTIMITPNGTWGLPGAKTVPLIRVKDMDAFRDFYKSGDADWTFYPLYVSELGKGRIVGCQFPAWSPMPKDLMSATEGEFNLRAVLWVGRRLDVPSTRP